MSNGKTKRSTSTANHLELAMIKPLTDNQEVFLSAPGHIVAHGSAGTGKTLLAMYRGLLSIEDGDQDKVVVVRSAVPTRDMGFLPGTDKEKASIYEAPYKDAATKLYGRGDAYEILKAKGVVEFITTSFVRGINIDNAVLIVDECQNMTYQELDSIITRIGKNCLVLFCGDWAQSDLKNNGIKDFYKVLRQMDEFTFIEFGIDDVVRSKLVKNYLITKARVLNESNSK